MSLTPPSNALYPLTLHTRVGHVWLIPEHDVTGEAMSDHLQELRAGRNILIHAPAVARLLAERAQTRREDADES